MEGYKENMSRKKAEGLTQDRNSKESIPAKAKAIKLFWQLGHHVFVATFHVIKTFSGILQTFAIFV